MDTGQLVISISVLVPVFIVAWVVQLRTENAGWVDVVWALGTAIIGAYYAISGPGDVYLRCLLALIYLIWFGRLGLHLARRIAHDEYEDGRYEYMRAWAGERAPWVFLIFYLMQAGWVWLFTLPAWVIAHGQWPNPLATSLALVTVVTAWLGENLADRQLHRFKQQPDNQGRTCREGLWRYSRHPNYFFEWCHWFCYPLLGMASPLNYWLWLAPLVMFLFLYFITGIPFTEQQSLRRRGDDYRQYQKSTSMFIPWKPKSE